MAALRAIVFGDSFAPAIAEFLDLRGLVQVRSLTTEAILYHQHLMDAREIERLRMEKLHRTAMESMQNAARAMTGVLPIATLSQAVHQNSLKELTEFAHESLRRFGIPVNWQPPPCTPRLDSTLPVSFPIICV